MKISTAKRRTSLIITYKRQAYAPYTRKALILALTMVAEMVTQGCCTIRLGTTASAEYVPGDIRVRWLQQQGDCVEEPPMASRLGFFLL
jgi:histone acetyltransferase (RNA polymerase elongator complex component)